MTHIRIEFDRIRETAVNAVHGTLVVIDSIQNPAAIPADSLCWGPD